MFFDILIFIRFALSQNYAILFGTSCNFYNYRHTANVMILSDLLIKNGFTKKEIVLMLGDNSMEDDRNIDKENVHLSDKVKIKLPDVDVEEGTVQDFFNAIICNHQKLIECDKSSNVVVYISGHGNIEFLKVQYREAILSIDLNYRIKALSERVAKVLLIIDTCKAESFILMRKFPENVFVATTSSSLEPSISSFWSRDLGVHSSCNFAYYFHHIAKNVQSMPLTKFFDMFKRSMILSTMKFAFFDASIFNFKDFFKQSKLANKPILMPI